MNKEILLTITKSGFFKRLKFLLILRFSIWFLVTFSIILLSINAYAIQRELVFDPSPDEAFGKVEGYKLYYGKVEGSIESFDIENYEPKTLDLGMKTGHPLPLPDLEFEVGVTYYFAATAYGYGKESAFSEFLLYTVPTNTPNTYTIVASADSGGSISPDGNVTLNYGDSQTFTITPDTGHKILDVIVNGQSKGKINTHTFDNVTSDQTISATFETHKYTIVASADSGGSISPDGNITVNYGGTQTFTITPDTGHKILDVIVNGQSKGKINTYTFDNVTSDQTISATFETIHYTIVASADLGGSISPDGNITVNYGGTQTFTITPDTGHKIHEVMLDGEPIGEISTYTFDNVTDSHEISVKFKIIEDPEPDPSAHIIEMGEVFVNHQWQRVSFTGIFIDPVVVAKPASLNDPKPGVVRIRNVDETGFDIRIQEWDYLKGIHGYENVSYLAIEKGYYVLPEGIIMEAGAFEADGNNFRFRPYSGTFNQIPVVIASITSVKDPTAVTGRISNVSQNGFEYFLQREEKNKRKHGVETVSFIAFEPFSGVMNQLKLEVGTTGNQVNHNFHYLSYKEKFSNIPYFLADMQTTNDSDTANVRWRNKNHYGLEIHISEEKSRDAELNHNNENLGYIIILD
jgi:hypothetical protein